MSEEYKVVIDNIQKFENKMAFAKEKGDRNKAKGFKQILNELYVKREALRNQYPKEAFETLQEQMRQKDEQIKGLQTQNLSLMNQIDEINKNIARLSHSQEIEEEKESEEELTECPKCHRMFKNLGAHQRYCKQGDQ